MSDLVPVWFLILAGLLPQISEAIYSPALPTVVLEMGTTATMMQYTLSIFLLGFGVGVLFWGRLSDYLGRKPALLGGMLVFAAGSLGCFLCTDVYQLLLFRFFQAFGGAVGSVIGQSICRDAFEGAARGRVFALISAALALSPALGPLIGGLTVEYVGWRMIFMFFVAGGLLTVILGFLYLKETHPASKRQGPKPQIIEVFLRMSSDPKVIVFGGLVGGINGIGFAYYGEGPFYLMGMLGLSPSLYGLSFFAIALGFLMGSFYSKFWHQKSIPYARIIQRGLLLMLVGASLFAGAAIFGLISLKNPLVSAAATIACMFITVLGMGMVVANCLAFALDQYQACVGTASSLFGAYYYVVVSLVTFLLGTLRVNKFWVMPSYFLGIVALMLVAYRWWLGWESRAQKQPVQ